MTVGQLLSSITSAELAEWRAYYQVRDEIRAEEREQSMLESEALRGAQEIRNRLRSD